MAEGIICDLLAGLTYVLFKILGEVVRIRKMMEEETEDK